MAEAGDAGPPGCQKALHHANHKMMETNQLIKRHSAQPLEIRRGGRVLGPQPQRGRLPTTGGHPTSSCTARRRGVRYTDREKTPTPRNVNILQWNAEGVYNKKVPLAERLHQENIEVACLQETHLKEKHRFTMRGYQVFRHDREGRSKGGVAILVKNSIPAKEFIISTNNQAEIHGVNIVVNAEHLLQNCRLHDAPRQASWPEPVPLRVKLFGGLEDLQRTAAFVRAIGISI
ncbi:hypothetical protein V1264_010344 [Littorina saxatilis]|uniref:Endonuclease/exonuclease/phosphatase domain-containing protein n=1 Tax=Littorina saxatilis TaxID=31220 RepID=A0AAN9AP99_9CAEN